MQRKTAEELLKDYLVSEKLPHSYQIGCFAKRVTLHAQQVRAFNLVWALSESGRLKDYRKIVVIGGGLAGMTVSAGLVVSDCEVTLYEQSSFLMQLQRGNRLRFIHPCVFR